MSEKTFIRGYCETPTQPSGRLMQGSILIPLSAIEAFVKGKTDPAYQIVLKQDYEQYLASKNFTKIFANVNPELIGKLEILNPKD